MAPRNLGALLFFVSLLACNLIPSVDPTGEAPAASSRALLNEVLFLPATGEAAFVELKSSGGRVSLAGLYLVNERGESFSLPEDILDLAPDQFLLIVFDGGDRVEENTVHADPTGFLGPESGFVELYAPDNSLLDRAAWGADQPGRVKLSRGGIITELEPGTTVGRFPLSTQLDFLEWTIFAPAQATPGAANPQPGVEVMLPLNGAIISRSSFGLSWYPAPGATQYRVQVAGEEAFSALIVDATVDTPVLEVQLQPGSYFWRVQAVAEDGAAAVFSPVQTITVNLVGSSLHLAAPPAQASLAVPLISQHKDTAMLLLESKNETGDHAWDVDHGFLDPTDPADNGNCALASVAMINAFFGGDLSQDRIGFEIFHDAGPGPEYDLMYGQGLFHTETTEALNFALETVVVFRPQPENLDVFWADVRNSIDAKAPVLAAQLPGHAFVITGYSVVEGRRSVTINDPWYAEWGPYTIGIADIPWKYYWMVSPDAIPVMNDPEIHMHSDGDGIVDFDETMRFATNPNDEDSDQDDLNDKNDVRYSVFHERWGYAVAGLIGRDWDSDRILMELDEDSDGGGCFDGMEDFDQNGKYESPETDNYEELDDACFWGTHEIVSDATTVFEDGSIHQYQRHFTRFSLHAEENGTLDGLARISYTHTGENLNDDCGLMGLVGGEALAWQVQLSGDYQKAQDGSILFNVQATPPNGPDYTLQWVGGACTEFSEPWQNSWPWDGFGGTLVDGVFDAFYDYSSSLVGQTGEFWFKIHMEQGAGLEE